MSKSNVYDQNAKHFALVKAYAIVNSKGEQVGLMNCKYPKDGMGKLYVYLHLFGSVMKVVSVSGCGYDKLGTALYKHSKTYTQDQETELKQDQIEFLKALESCDSGFDSWAIYGSYKFLRAI